MQTSILPEQPKTKNVSVSRANRTRCGAWLSSMFIGTSLLVGASASLLVARPTVAIAATSASGSDNPFKRKKRKPPPAIIPTAETVAAQKEYGSGNYQAAIVQAKAALNKNERYTPAMLIMAKAYFKVKKYEWTRTLWGMMKANKASAAEQAEMYQILAFMEIERKNTPVAIKFMNQAVQNRSENPIFLNNLGALYLTAKNYGKALPVLEKAVSLQPAFVKAHLNLGSAYRGTKNHQKALASYQQAIQLFPNYADAIYNMAILHLDANKMPNLDDIARLNVAIGHFEQYKQLLGGALPKGDKTEEYIAEAREKIIKVEKAAERKRKRAEREAKRAARKAEREAKAAAEAEAAAAAEAAAPPQEETAPEPEAGSEDPPADGPPSNDSGEK